MRQNKSAYESVLPADEGKIRTVQYEKAAQGSLKLNGLAELFFRKASIDARIEHKKGTVLVNKTYKTVIDGKEVRVPIPDKEYQEIYNYYVEQQRCFTVPDIMDWGLHQKDHNRRWNSG